MQQNTYRQELVSCCELVVVVLCTQALQDRPHVDTMQYTAALSILATRQPVPGYLATCAAAC